MKKYFIALFLSLITTAYAQTQKLNLQQCIDIALEKNDKIVSASKSVERATALQGTAWDVDKTAISLSQDPTSGGSPDNALSVSQTIDFPTLYIARHKQLKAETKAENSRLEVVRKEVVAEVTAAYCQWQYEHRRVALLMRQDSLLTRFVQQARQRRQASEARQLEVLSAERMQRENQLEVTMAQNDVEQARLALEQLLKTAGIEPADTLLAPLSANIEPYNYSQTSNGLYAADRLSAADRAVTVAKNGYAPSLSLSFRHQAVFSSWDPYHVQRSRFDGGNFMGFEVGVGIPLFYGATKAKVKAARKDREIAQLEMQAEQQQREKEYQNLMNRLNAAHNRLEYYAKDGTVKANEMMRLGTLEYEQGEISYVEYTNVLRESIDIQLKEAAAINEYNKAVIALQKEVR
jgi:outer membrane protein TolC